MVQKLIYDNFGLFKYFCVPKHKKREAKSYLGKAFIAQGSKG